ncbi:MAG: hypothetical protein M1838_002916 [Thelocarpon superellum]|nr:MAG: hypothetical protein M1838_002916 [Thelocarpon superellum]
MFTQRVTRAMSAALSEASNDSGGTTSGRRQTARSTRSNRSDKGKGTKGGKDELPSIVTQHNFAYGTAKPLVPDNLESAEMKDSVGNLMGSAPEYVPISHNTRSRASKSPSLSPVQMAPPRQTRQTPSQRSTRAGRGAQLDVSMSFGGESGLFGTVGETTRPISRHQALMNEYDDMLDQYSDRAPSPSITSPILSNTPVQRAPTRFAEPTPENLPHATEQTPNIPVYYPVSWLSQVWNNITYHVPRILLVLVLVVAVYSATMMVISDLHADPTSLNGTSTYISGLPATIEQAFDRRLTFVEQNFAKYRADDTQTRTWAVEKKLAKLETQVKTHSNEIEAAIQASSKLNHDYYYRRVNFFSLGLGAAIDPYLTSPTAQVPSTMVQRMVSRLLPVGGMSRPNAPAAALEGWNDIGDCWCTPSAEGKAQLAVVLPRKMWPTEITVEHIPSTATLEVDSAPRLLELWAEVLDPAARDLVLEKSSRLGPQPSPSDVSLPPTFVRIAEWEYNIHWAVHVQVHELFVDMQRMDAAVSKAVVRVAKNWGDSPHTCLYRVRLGGVLAEDPRGH